MKKHNFIAACIVCFVGRLCASDSVKNEGNGATVLSNVGLRAGQELTSPNSSLRLTPESLQALSASNGSTVHKRNESDDGESTDAVWNFELRSDDGWNNGDQNTGQPVVRTVREAIVASMQQSLNPEKKNQ